MIWLYYIFGAYYFTALGIGLYQVFYNEDVLNVMKNRKLVMNEIYALKQNIMDDDVNYKLLVDNSEENIHED